MVLKRNARRPRIASKVVKKAPNGAKIKIDRRDKSGLSLTEFKQIRKMLPKVEVKMAPVKILGMLTEPFVQNSVLPQIPIIGQGISGNLGLTYGADKIRQGTGDGERIGASISVKKAHIHVQWCIDEQKTSPSIDPGPYQFRWFLYRTKGTLEPMGGGGLPLNVNQNWNAMYDLGNDNYVAPTSLVPDMYNKFNTNLYTIYKQGQFNLHTSQRKTEPAGDYITQPMMQSDNKVFKHLYLDVTKYIAKTLKYVDDPALPTNQCTNDALYLSYTFIRYDNQPVLESFLVNCTSLTTLYYTDS